MTVLLFRGEEGFDFENTKGGEVAWGAAIRPKEFSVVEGLGESDGEGSIVEMEIFELHI